MKTIAISVTEAARNFSDCINRARYQGTTFVLHKNGVAVARIVPEPDSAQASPEKSTERAALRPKASTRSGRPGSRPGQSR